MTSLEGIWIVCISRSGGSSGLRRRSRTYTCQIWMSYEAKNATSATWAGVMIRADSYCDRVRTHRCFSCQYCLTHMSKPPDQSSCHPLNLPTEPSTRNILSSCRRFRENPPERACLYFLEVRMSLCSVPRCRPPVGAIWKVE